MAKGDYVQVVVRGAVQVYEVTVEKQGRVVEDRWDQDGKIQWFVVEEKTRGGTLTRTMRFPATEILAISTFRKEI